MTKLSLLLYLANVAENSGNVLGVTLFGITVYVAVMLVWSMVRRDHNDSHPSRPLPEVGPNWKFALGVAAPALALMALIPSSKTVYMIAGVEVASVAVTTPEVQATLGQVHELIDAKLSQMIEEIEG